MTELDILVKLSEMQTQAQIDIDYLAQCDDFTHAQTLEALLKIRKHLERRIDAYYDAIQRGEK